MELNKKIGATTAGIRELNTHLEKLSTETAGVLDSSSDLVIYSGSCSEVDLSATVDGDLIESCSTWEKPLVVEEKCKLLTRGVFDCCNCINTKLAPELISELASFFFFSKCFRGGGGMGDALIEHLLNYGWDSSVGDNVGCRWVIMWDVGQGITSGSSRCDNRVTDICSYLQLSPPSLWVQNLWRWKEKDLLHLVVFSMK